MKEITLASYNMHGTQQNDSQRFKKIAELLCEHKVDICGFQEVINGCGIEDTSYTVARFLKMLTGEEWRTYWTYCHLFYDRYPEGISILSRFPMKNIEIVNLDTNVNGKTPLMQRYALYALIDCGSFSVNFATTHLDHHNMASIRTQQAQKIIDSFKDSGASAAIEAIVGDFNAKENSKCLKLFKKNKFIDTYRKINKQGGDTFPASNPFCRIDYIMCRGKIKVKSSSLMDSDNELSDHIGIVTKLAL